MIIRLFHRKHNTRIKILFALSLLAVSFLVIQEQLRKNMDDNVGFKRSYESNARLPKSTVLQYRVKRFQEYMARTDVHGPGENGEGVHLTDSEQKEADSLFIKEAFNIIASDKTSLVRTIRDTREAG